MKGVTKALISMNKKMDLPGLQKVMSDFMRENEKSEITQEALADALDDAMEEEGSSEQEESIVNQVRFLWHYAHLTIAVFVVHLSIERSISRLHPYFVTKLCVRFWTNLESVWASQSPKLPKKLW